jgi:hypothetical protein
VGGGAIIKPRYDTRNMNNAITEPHYETKTLENEDKLSCNYETIL